MKKVFLVLLSGISAVCASGQTPGKLILKKGMVIEAELVSYKTPLFIDAAKFIKMKQGKRDAEVQKFNEDIAAGKIAPAAKTVLPTVINDVQETNTGVNYNGTVKIGATDYKLCINVAGDTTRYILNDAVAFPIVNKGDTTGLWLFGVRKFPANPEPGSYFPGYVNEMSLFPWDLKINKRKFFQFNGNDGYSYSGFVNERKTINLSSNSIIMNTPFFVMGKEDIEISGKTYTSYKLLNAQWIKSTTNSVVTEDPTIYFNDPALSDKIKNNLSSRGHGWDTKEKIDKLLKSTTDKVGLTNEYGYMENYQENWYVPELGMFVKMKFYDGYGALQMESVIKSIK